MKPTPYEVVKEDKKPPTCSCIDLRRLTEANTRLRTMVEKALALCGCRNGQIIAPMGVMDYGQPVRYIPCPRCAAIRQELKEESEAI